MLRLPRQGPAGRHADPEAGPRDRLLRQLQADPLLRAGRSVVGGALRRPMRLDSAPSSTAPRAATRDRPARASTSRPRATGPPRSTSRRSATRPTTSRSTARCCSPSRAPRSSARRRSSIASDSLLLVAAGPRPLQGQGAAPEAPRHAKALRARRRRFRRFAITHVPREENKKADRLANLGADASERRARRQEVPARAVIALPVEDIARRRAEILAADRPGRRARRAAAPTTVALMAVTKGHGARDRRATPRAPASRSSARTGCRKDPRRSRRSATDFRGSTWRLIGPLQSNKAKSALQWFAAVESLDRERLAVRLEALLAEGAPAASCRSCSRSTSGGEASKSGVPRRRRSRLLEAALGLPAPRRPRPHGRAALRPTTPRGRARTSGALARAARPARRRGSAARCRSSRWG